jgi:tetratricopeptide (TPR) repeat protein
MRISYVSPAVAAVVSLVLLFASLSLRAQVPNAHAPFMLVTSYGKGGIALPSGKEWKPELLTVYDNGKRPVAQYSKTDSTLTASFILFENLSGKPSAEGCREDVISALLQHEAKNISDRVDKETKNPAGETVATTTYRLNVPQKPGVHQVHLFGFEGDAKTCAEIHVSSMEDTRAAEDAMKAVLTDFHPNLTYEPNAIDTFRLGSLLFKKSPGPSAQYYKSSLDAMPTTAEYLNPRRAATDQLVMSLGMSGNLKEARAIAEKAVKADPDYPLNYYNLACIDAEQGNAAGAKTYLQQAFDRKANLIHGESMPDPSKDDSILELKNNHSFWEYVVSLAKSNEPAKQ